MCGIVAYVGKRRCRDYIIRGLKRLEYRGYDSAGFICVDEKHKRFSYFKKSGKVSDLEKGLDGFEHDGFVGMGHTRWATHGVVNDCNAHPHFNCKKNISLVHNGIIEGYEEIRKKLIFEGHEFVSSTDTEVVAHYFSSIFDFYKDLKPAILDLVSKLKGAYSFVLSMEEYPDQIVVVRHNSPLVLGKLEDEIFVASDLLAFSDKTKNVCFLPEDSFAIIKKDSVDMYDFSGKKILPIWQEVKFEFDAVDKQGFEHYMLKEIYEQKKVIDNTINFCRLIGTDSKLSANTKKDNSVDYKIDLEYQDRIWQQLGLSLKQVKNLKKVNLVAAGTSWHACRIAQFFFENFCKIPASVYLASEFCYMPLFNHEDSVYIFVSQSGETADTLQALRKVSPLSIPTITITNVPSSTMVREADGFFPMQAGPEISVASTKAFSSQISVLYLLANRIALEKGLISLEEMKRAEDDLFVSAQILEQSIENYKYKITQKLANKYSKFDKFIFLGRHISYPFAMEAALKLKEISYIFAQCYPAGELKHGPIALIDKSTPVVLFSSLHEIVYKKIISNAQEVKARSGHLVVFAFDGQDELINLANTSFIVPRVNPFLGPLAMTGLMQFFIYQITKKLGCSIDKPRNLAKSVTVE
ncbi:glutamine--fructose-6-phosphate transaminase (isomerizing) [Candidatus Dependentiae bacterium]|nr:glutamine--fructose-6-phosphate transaminase (isomerizing) [Candidatus Dependentiae bacterium]